jgi:hypothetical protein
MPEDALQYGQKGQLVIFYYPGLHTELTTDAGIYSDNYTYDALSVPI